MPEWPRLRQTLDALLAFENLLAGGGMQYKEEYAAALRIVFNPYFSLMRFDDGLANRQAEPDSLPCHFFPLLDLVELVKNSPLVVVGHARTGVGDRNMDRTAALIDASDDFTVFRRKFQGVFQQIADDLRDAI